MKIAFIGDIHGYAPALREALAICEEEGVNRVVGLGDYIDGYDGNEECVALVRGSFVKAVWGNHDENHGGELSPEAADWLKHLPGTLQYDDWLVTHSSPREKRQGEFIRSPIEAWSCFDDCGFQRCVVGHAHRPMLYRFAKGRVADCDALDATGDGQILDRDSRYLFVNPSLAYNRRGNPSPGFSIFDNETQRLRIIYLNRAPIIDSY
ncbi:MAG: metallophosphoesterase family protein [Planctomycetota bacterium]|nr:metallophosphoesterase family protein [Planctomycetota bacterium]